MHVCIDMCDARRGRGRRGRGEKNGVKERAMHPAGLQVSVSEADLMRGGRGKCR